MKQKSLSMSLFLTVAVFGQTVLALDLTSSRIKSLEDNLAGHIQDEYTDLLFNPARSNNTYKNIYGKITADNNRGAFALSVNRFLFLVELSDSSFGRNSDLLFPRRPGFITSYSREFALYRGWSPSAYDDISLGIGIIPRWHRSTFSFADSSQLAESEHKNLAVDFLLSGLKQTDSTREREMVFKGTLSKSRHHFRMRFEADPEIIIDLDSSMQFGLHAEYRSRDLKEQKIRRSRKMLVNWNRSDNQHIIHALYSEGLSWQGLERLQVFTALQVRGTERRGAAPISTEVTLTVPVSMEFHVLESLALRAGLEGSVRRYRHRFRFGEFQGVSGTLNDFSAGFGWTPVESFVFDFHALISEPSGIDSWGIQAKYAF